VVDGRGVEGSCSDIDRFDILQGGGFFALRTRTDPETVTFIMRFQGREVGRSQFAPMYIPFNPNRPDCPPNCRTAHGEEIPIELE
jgi:hypothetical protein